jgi:hypothetical protein
MKLFAFLLTFSAANAALPAFGGSRQLHKLPDEVAADTELGGKILSQARRLNDNNGDVEFTWVADYSIKFQGCHHISQWNEEADDAEDVRIATKRLVRFRLCPTNTCTLQNAGGCNSGYGDYVIDMNVFLDAYVESVEQYNEARCEYLQNSCGCDNDNGDYCLYDCYVAHGMESICAEENPYANNGNGNNNNNNNNAFELANYVECAQAEFGNNNNNRQLNDGGYAYYIGPYCAEQGGAIYLGMFTDDTCTTFADEYGGQEAYYRMSGTELPYGNSNVISMDCYSCLEPEAQYNYDGNDNQDGDNVNEMCEAIYQQAGKCETELGQYYAQNYNACSYIQGIQVIRKNGIIVSSGSKANKTASIFIGVFVVAFVLLSAYVYYLKTKLDRATINLSE